MKQFSPAKRLVESAVVADLAVDFVEEEVGRLDWIQNLDLLKTQGKLEAKLQAWIHRQRLPSEYASLIISEIEQLVKNPGRWR